MSDRALAGWAILCSSVGALIAVLTYCFLAGRRPFWR